MIPDTAERQRDLKIVSEAQKQWPSFLPCWFPFQSFLCCSIKKDKKLYFAMIRPKHNNSESVTIEIRELVQRMIIC
jgi:hypothetical protein